MGLWLSDYPDLGILLVEKIQANPTENSPAADSSGERAYDCLQREFLEELDLPVHAGAHIYTTDFFSARFSAE